MSRFKTFDATGIAPGGRIFAGDLNAIQDRYADLTGNFAQTLDVGAVRVGDTSIQLTKYGTAEARITAALRVDGIFRGLGGLLGGTFTTTQRDAIPAGQRPFGLVILNTTTAQYEWNKGTDAVPVWEATSPPPFTVGHARPWFGTLSSLVGIQEPDPGWLLCNGASLLRAGAYANLFTHVGTAYGAVDGTHFNLPDMTGKMMMGADLVGHDRGETGGEFAHTLSATEMPSHSHTVNSHNHGGVTGGESATHSHVMSHSDNSNTTLTGGGDRVVQLNGGSSGPLTTNSGQNSAGHTHTVASEAPGTNAQGGGLPHENMPPFVVIGGWVIKY